MKGYLNLLSGGHPNSLGNTIEVVFDVLDDPNNFEELYNCYSSTDQVVRLRVSNAMKRIMDAKKKILVPYIPKFISEVSQIDQASAQWTLADLFLGLAEEMTEEQLKQAKALLKKNLESQSDWIVLNNTMNTLGEWAKKDEELKEWIKPHLDRIVSDERKSVKSKAESIIEALNF
ncbi:MAG: hypothetical protein AAF551_09405 [Bacteroidota bacterium]